VVIHDHSNRHVTNFGLRGDWPVWVGTDLLAVLVVRGYRVDLIKILCEFWGPSRLVTYKSVLEYLTFIVLRGFVLD
jgi:hypothetical protein